MTRMMVENKSSVFIFGSIIVISSLFISPIFSLLFAFIFLVLFSNINPIASGYFAVFYFIVVFYYIGMSSPIVSDTLEYKVFFDAVGRGDAIEARFNSEIFIYYLVWFTKLFSDKHEDFFAVVLTVEIVLLLGFLYRWGKNSLLSISLLLSFFIISPLLYTSSLFTIRQMLSVLFFLNGYIANKRITKVAFYSSAAMSHSSILLFFVFEFGFFKLLFRTWKIAILLLVLSFIVSFYMDDFFLFFTNLIGESDATLLLKANYYSRSEFSPPGILSSIVFQSISFYFIGVYFLRNLNLTDIESRLVTLYCFSALLVILFSSFFNLSFRLGYISLIFSPIIIIISMKYMFFNKKVMYLSVSLSVIYVLLFLKWAVYNDLGANSRIFLNGGMLYGL